ncbi:MAG: hypothetical protein LBD01_01045 [Puniceicoccales bacterium]|jgi:hypothetical protein|nr:hypothetical protein [Puniceicoccales bacterium]
MRFFTHLLKFGLGIPALAVAFLLCGCQQSRLTVETMAPYQTVVIAKGDMASFEGGPTQASVSDVVAVLRKGLAAKGYTVVEDGQAADLVLAISYRQARTGVPAEANESGASFILSLRDGVAKRIWTATIAAEFASTLTQDALEEIPAKSGKN